MMRTLFDTLGGTMTRVLALAGLLLASVVLAGALGYRAYLAAPEVAAVATPPSRHPARAERAVLFVIDALHPGRAFDPQVMPTFTRLAARGASGVVRTGPLTTTAPSIYSLTTGRPGTLVQAIFNFHSRPTRIDSLLSLMAADRGRIALAGDPAWHRQFGWLVPAPGRHESPEPGITTEAVVDVFDTRAVDFLVAKLADPTYRLLIVHLGSADAVGHMVTPLAARYFEQLTFLDGLLARVVHAADLQTTLLLVTGDHGMAARGTHGGEEEARLTPYVLAGPGVKRGVVTNVPQPALTATLSALLGLPFLPISESPPRTDLLDVSPDAADALTAEYFSGKYAAAGFSTTASTGDRGHDVPPTADSEAANQQLNEHLFGTGDSRVGLRLLTAVVGMLTALAIATIAFRSVPARLPRPSLREHLGWTAVGPIALALAAAAFMHGRGAVPVRSTSLALGIACALLLAIVAASVSLSWSRRLRDWVAARHLSLFMPALMIVTAPLVNSHWFRPRPYFELLVFATAVVIAVLVRSELGERARGALRLPALTAAVIYVPQIPLAPPARTSLLLFGLSMTVLGFALRNLKRTRDTIVSMAPWTLGALFAIAWLWRIVPSTEIAAAVLTLFGFAVLTAVQSRARIVTAANVVIAASAALFVLLASDGHETFVFFVAALAAMLVASGRVDLTRPGMIYAVAGAAIVLRICLHFELGDHYNLSSIRTAPGFVLADSGLPLGSVVALLFLKYSLPWCLIFAALLPSLAAAGMKTTLHFIDVLALAYVARLAVVMAVVDPLRALPNGMDGIVGAFCVTLAECVTFVIAAVLLTLLAAPPRAGAATATA